MTDTPQVSEELPKHGLIVIRSDAEFPPEGLIHLQEVTRLPVLLLPRDSDVDIMDVDEMRRLGWMPVPKEIIDKVDLSEGEVTT